MVQMWFGDIYFHSHQITVDGLAWVVLKYDSHTISGRLVQGPKKEFAKYTVHA